MSKGLGYSFGRLCSTEKNHRMLRGEPEPSLETDNYVIHPDRMLEAHGTTPILPCDRFSVALNNPNHITIKLRA